MCWRSVAGCFCNGYLLPLIRGLMREWVLLCFIVVAASVLVAKSVP
jgi:hypothetical protein